MATCSLVIYYLVPNDNRNHITFMDERTGRTEADFVRGMTFVLVDAVVEGATFAVLVAFMRRVVHVDPMHVGWYLVTRHRAYVFWIHLCICIFFMCMFLRHNGCDTSLQFLWLSPEFSYDPSNQTHPVLWT